MVDHFQLGEAFFGRGEYVEACEEYEQAIALKQDYVEAYHGWGVALSKLERYEEASVKFQKVTELKSEDANAYFNWGNALFNQKQYEEASAKYQKATELNPDFDLAFNGWGAALFNLERYKEASAKFQKVTELKSEDANAYFNWGNALFNLQQYEEASVKFQKATELNSKYANAYFNWGRALFNLKQYEEASVKFQKTTELKPDYADAYFHWGFALDNLKQYEEAIAQYQNAININPDYTYAYHNIANIYWQQGAYRLGREKWKITTESFNRTKEAEKQNKNAYHFLYYGTVLLTLNDLDRSEENYQEGLAIDPTNLDILTELANFYVKKAAQDINEKSLINWSKARQYYIKARKLLTDKINKKAAQDINEKSPINWSKARQYYTKARKLLTDKIYESDDITTALNLGKLYLIMEEYEEAENYLLKALKKESNSIEVLNSLGALYIGKEDFKKGTEYFKKSIKIDPDNLDIRSNLAQSYLKLQQLTDAEREYRKILSITSYHVESHIGLGEVYIEMAEQGDSDIYLQAIRHFTQAIKISKNNEGSKQLSKKELSQVQYLSGYARIKLHESSTMIRDGNLVSGALGDFNHCIKNDPENYKGRRAVEKLQKQANILRTQTLSQWIGTLFILIPSLFILGMTQWTYWKPFFSQDNNLSTSQSVVKLQKTSQPSNKLNTTEYFLLTFGSLTFSLISLYLPQLLKLKISGTGIELEKSSIDQIKTTQITTSLGINK